MITQSQPLLLKLDWRLLGWFLGCILFACAVLLPFQSGSWLSFYKQMLAVLALIFWVLSVRPRKWHGVSLFLVVLMLSVVLQYMAGIINFADDALLSVAYLFMLLLSFEVGVELRESEKDGQRGVNLWIVFLWTLLAVSILSALVAVHQWLGATSPEFEFPLIYGRPYGNLAQPNHLATFLILGICAVLFLFQRKAFSGWAGGLLVGFLLIAVALTLSRVAWLFAAISCVHLLWKRRRDESLVPLYWVFFFVAFFVISIFLTEYLSHQLQLSQLSVVERVSSNQMNRLRIWKGLFDAVLSGPWYGYGWMQVATASLASAALKYGEYFNFSHSLILDLLIWLGPWLGGVIVIAGGGWLLRVFLSSHQYDETVCWLALGALLLHSLVEFPFAYTYFLVPGGMFLGWALGNKPQLVWDGANWGRRIAVVAAAVLLIGAAIITWEYALLTKSKFNDQMRQARITSFAQINLNQVSFLDSLKDWQEVKRLPPQGKLTTAQSLLLKRVASRMPTWSNLERLELDYVVRGDKAGVCRVLDAVGKLYDQRSINAARRLAMDGLGSNCKRQYAQFNSFRSEHYPVVL